MPSWRFDPECVAAFQQWGAPTTLPEASPNGNDDFMRRLESERSAEHTGITAPWVDVPIFCRS